MEILFDILFGPAGLATLVGIVAAGILCWLLPESCGKFAAWIVGLSFAVGLFLDLVKRQGNDS